MLRYRTLPSALPIALAALVLAGCGAERGTMPRPEAHETSTVLGAEVSSSVQAASDTERPVEFTLGPNRFVLPANWFVDGIGQDFQGGVTLALHWPSLQPYPPGQPYSSFTSGPMGDQRVLVTISYIDRVPIDALPERHVTQDPGEDVADPVNNIALRDRLPDQFELEHHVVNLDRFEAWVNRFPGHRYSPAKDLVGRSFDWFIGRDASGRVRTVVKCDDGREPDGFEIRDETLVSVPGATRWPQCGSHLFSMPEYSISVKAGYARPILRDWRRIETTAREALRLAHDAAKQTPTSGAPRP